MAEQISEEKLENLMVVEEQVQPKLDLRSDKLPPPCVEVFIPGIPYSGSNLKFNRKTGNAFRPKEHKQRIYTVHEYALSEMEKMYPNHSRPIYPKGTALYLECAFSFPYRQQDYRTGKYENELKPNAPTYMVGNKDIDNMLKSLKDGLQGVIYQNDNQICQYRLITKRYSENPNTLIRVGLLTGE